MNSLRRRSRALWAGLTLLLILLLAACYPDNPQSTFGVSGPVAQSQLNLLYWILGAALFVFVVVGAILMYITIRYRRRAGDGDPEQIHGNTPLEIGWTIAPSLVLVVIAVPTVLTVFDNLNSPDPNAMTVDVVGHQWWFEFKYPHPDGESTVVTANELHIPVGEVVNINLDSKDVLHSFWIPKIAGKVDLVPGNKNFMWIQADEAGEYLGQCAEFCGEAHALMRFRVDSGVEGGVRRLAGGRGGGSRRAGRPAGAAGQGPVRGQQGAVLVVPRGDGIGQVSRPDRAQPDPRVEPQPYRGGRGRDEPGEPASVAGGPAVDQAGDDHVQGREDIHRP